MTDSIKIYVTKRSRPHVNAPIDADGYATVLFDSEDRPVIDKHRWTMGNYGSPKTKINGVETSMPSVIMKQYSPEQLTQMMDWTFHAELLTSGLFWMTDGESLDCRKKNITWGAPF